MRFLGKFAIAAIAILLQLGYATPALAHRAFLSDQEFVAGGRVCYYQYFTKTYTKNVGVLKACPLYIDSDEDAQTSGGSSYPAFFSHDEVRGSSRICYYNSWRGTRVESISILRFCPLKITVE